MASPIPTRTIPTNSAGPERGATTSRTRGSCRPNTPDLMTYCDPRRVEIHPHYGVWISGYHYAKALEFRVRRGR